MSKEAITPDGLVDHEAHISAWDRPRPVKASVPAADATAAGAAVAAPASSASSQSMSSPLAAVDSDARKAIGEVHADVSRFIATHDTNVEAINENLTKFLAELDALAERVRLLELHASNPAGHDAPPPAAAPGA